MKEFIKENKVYLICCVIIGLSMGKIYEDAYNKGFKTGGKWVLGKFVEVFKDVAHKHGDFETEVELNEMLNTL